MFRPPALSRTEADVTDVASRCIRLTLADSQTVGEGKWLLCGMQERVSV